MTAACQHEKAQARIVRMMDALVIESERVVSGDHGTTTVEERHYHRAQLKLAKAATGAVMRAAPPKGRSNDDDNAGGTGV